VEKDAQQAEGHDLIEGWTRPDETPPGELKDEERRGGHQSEQALPVLSQLDSLKDAVQRFKNERKVSNQHPPPKEVGEDSLVSPDNFQKFGHFFLTDFPLIGAYSILVINYLIYSSLSIEKIAGP